MSPNEIYHQSGKDTILYQSTLHREFSDRAFNLLNMSDAILVAAGMCISGVLKTAERTPRHLVSLWPQNGGGHRQCGLSDMYISP